MRAWPTVVNGTGPIPRFALDPGPITEVHAFWLAGMSCDGCSISILGAHASERRAAAHRGHPRACRRSSCTTRSCRWTAGKEFMKAHHLAKEGKLGAPYVVIYEGSVADESIAGAFGGYWSAMGTGGGDKAQPEPDGALAAATSRPAPRR